MIKRSCLICAGPCSSLYTEASDSNGQSAPNVCGYAPLVKPRVPLVWVGDLNW